MGYADRFWSKVLIREECECWDWTAYVDPNGYGKFTVSTQRKDYAHRVAYSLAVGEIPQGMDIDHLCRNRRCVNPSHLEPVTRRTNLLRGDTIPSKNRAKSCCPSGHPYTPENTYSWNNARQCRKCRREADRRRRRPQGVS